VDRIDPQAPKHDPRTQAVQAAAQACDQHATNGDTVTLHTMQRTVQAALNLGATPTDIRAARNTAVNQ
jgi:hypothetical protein